ncbi:MAG: hypothetical protein Q8N48_07735, partial [Thiobacillus sp.]|nr:hypothetical protein [Thiobacillus sp.]MDP2978699.1 hypothetical protein [Thiobacillus sp.]
ECSTTLLIRHELNMTTVRPEPVEGLCFDRLSTNELTDKSGRINNEQSRMISAPIMVEPNRS